MKCAEQKENKRIKHCYPRKELYHRFVHSEEYAYTPQGRYECSCRFNILYIGRYRKFETEQDIIDNWFSIQSSVIAIIDRKKKKCIINNYFKEYPWELKRALPNDYSIYYVNGDIPYYDIFSRKHNDIFLQLQAEYLINNYKSSIEPYHIIINNLCKTTYATVEWLYDYQHNGCYREIKDFCHNNNISKRKWYNKPLRKYYKEKTYIYNGWSKIKSIDIPFPSLKSIVENTIFTEEELTLCEQRKFYSDYCYGHGIPFKDVINNWNNGNDWNKKLIAKYNRSNVVWDSEKYPTWKEFVIQTTTIINDFYKNQINTFIEQSNKNYEEAIEKLKQLTNNNDTINNWRQNNFPKHIITYKCYVPPVNKRNLGKWIEKRLNNYNYNYNRFDNTQLKLKDEHTIITSKYATVPLEEGIKWFKRIINYINGATGEKAEKLSPIEFNNSNIGIYNLRYCKYMTKVTDSNKSLNRKEWVIVIGCHHLWLDDIINFIHYYKLEKEFGL